MCRGTNTKRNPGGFYFVKICDIYRYMILSQLKNVVWKEGKYYVAQSLNVDVSSFGSTKKDALANLREALELYFEDSKNPRVTKVERPEFVTL